METFLKNNWPILLSFFIALIGVIVSICAHLRISNEGKIKKQTYFHHVKNQLQLLLSELYNIKNTCADKTTPVIHYTHRSINVNQRQIYNEYKELVFNNVTLSKKELEPFIAVINFSRDIFLTKCYIGEKEMNYVINKADKLLKKYQRKITKKDKIVAFGR